MKILVVGAGALGGYFGGRLLAAGKDVTFLVRPGRAKQLAATGGLMISSPMGNLTLPNPPLVQADALKSHYDLILLSCKAFALESCMNDITPAVGPETMILPVLNGMRHIDLLSERFGRKAVLGGRAHIFATLDFEGKVLHQGQLHTLDYGELDGGMSPRIEAVAAEIGDAGFDARLRPDIMKDLWEKWVMIATVAGSTSLMRAAIGDIVRAGGLPFMEGLLDECGAVAEHNGYPPSAASRETVLKTVSDPNSLQAASLAKDIDKGVAIEGDHIIGDLLARAPEHGADGFIRLNIVNTHLKTYEEKRARIAATR